MELFKKKSLQVGDRVVVGGWTDMKVVVSRIEPNHITGVVHVFLDWGIHGTSRVCEHDEGKIWFRHVELN